MLWKFFNDKTTEPHKNIVCDQAIPGINASFTGSFTHHLLSVIFNAHNLSTEKYSNLRNAIANFCNSEPLLWVQVKYNQPLTTNHLNMLMCLGISPAVVNRKKSLVDWNHTYPSTNQLVAWRKQCTWNTSISCLIILIVFAEYQIVLTLLFLYWNDKNRLGADYRATAHIHMNSENNTI